MVPHDAYDMGVDNVDHDRDQVMGLDEVDMKVLNVMMMLMKNVYRVCNG